ncbi:MAG: DoxX family protein [Oligoflexia bacterium]|nr:DoxX family protein [Oligoflexia bacterium]
MLIAFLESMKYMGHLWPIALLRIYIGYYFLSESLTKFKSDFLEQSFLQDILQRWWVEGMPPETVTFIQSWILPHWQIFNYVVVIGQLLVGIAYIAGFVVRPAAILAILLNSCFIVAGASEYLLTNKLLIAMHLTFLFIGAGRCFGFDYYFYKRVRGLWW